MEHQIPVHKVYNFFQIKPLIQSWLLNIKPEMKNQTFNFSYSICSIYEWYKIEWFLRYCATYSKFAGTNLIIIPSIGLKTHVKANAPSKISWTEGIRMLRTSLESNCIWKHVLKTIIESLSALHLFKYFLGKS